MPPEYRPEAAAVPQTDSLIPQQVFVPAQRAETAARPNTEFSAAGTRQPRFPESSVEPYSPAPESGGSPKGKKSKTRSPFKHLNKDELLEIIFAQEQRLSEANRRVEEISRQIDDRRLRFAQLSSANQPVSIQQGQRNAPAAVQEHSGFG